MMLLKMKAMAYCAFLLRRISLFAAPLFAQLARAHDSFAAIAAAETRRRRPKKKEARGPPRKTLAGYWKLNTDRAMHCKKKAG